MRKAEDDPAVSLRTRKARMVGKWRLYTAKGTYSELRGIFQNEWNYQNNVEVCISANPNLPDNTLYYSCELDFRKDETFELKMTTLSNSQGIMKGKWNFIFDKDRKENKTQVILFPESTSGVWPYNGVIHFPERQQIPLFSIDELRHDTITLSRSYEIANVGTSSGLPPKGTETFTFIPR
ncbi:MAG: hypothetical protein IM638_11780 [Bacteroidetes bacterium]|nr:hypothetical protein [Bacteroidota bacterium]